MFSAKVYRVMVGSLSGTMEEVYVAKETIRKWNLENAEREGKVFLPIEWSVKVNPDEVDVVLGIVGNWIENTPFIEDCIKAGNQVVLFFNAFQDPKNTIPSEHTEVNAFRENLSPICHCVDFNGIDDFGSLLKKQLDKVAEA